MAIGQNVQEAIDCMERGLFEMSFIAACTALSETIKRSLEKSELSETDFKTFVKNNWHLIAFTGLPRVLPLPLSFPFALKRIVPQFNVHHGAEEIIVLVIRQTLAAGRLPAVAEFNSNDSLEVKNNKLLLPKSLIRGLVGVVIVQPVNSDETVPDEYWINISDFKMFVSEFWGRIDLAERIVNFYAK
jgi:hypothetical protein